MITKKKVRQTLDELPEQFSVDELMDRLIFIEKVEQGLRDSQKGNTVSFEEAQERMKKWLA